MRAIAASIAESVSARVCASAGVAQNEAATKVLHLTRRDLFSIFSNMPKNTFQPNKRRRAKTHGFFARMATPGGRNVLRKRRQKGRWKLTPQ